MRVFIDEDLSPRLVGVAQERGYEATCVRDRGLLNAKDHELMPLVIEEEWVFVTSNAAHFRRHAREHGIHAGLVFIDHGSVDLEKSELEKAIEHIEQASAASGESPAAYMVNRLVVVDAGGSIDDGPWP